MEKHSSLLILLAVLFVQGVNAQQVSPVQKLFPQGTITYSNISYAGVEGKSQVT